VAAIVTGVNEYREGSTPPVCEYVGVEVAAPDGVYRMAEQKLVGAPEPKGVRIGAWRRVES
jgi:hypothetical protein